MKRTRLDRFGFLLGIITVLSSMLFVEAFTTTTLTTLHHCRSFTATTMKKKQDPARYIVPPALLHIKERRRRKHPTSQQQHPCCLYNQSNMNNGENDENNSIFKKLFSFSSMMVVGLPVFAISGIPVLVNFARSFPPNSTAQYAAVTVLIVSTRMYLYTVALTIVGLVATRGATYDPLPLGQRLTQLTEELLVLDRPIIVETTAPPSIEGKEEENTDIATATELTTTPPPPSFIQKMVEESGLEERLDTVNSETQAIALPVLVSLLLAVSVFSLGGSNFLTTTFFPDPSSSRESSSMLDADTLRHLQQLATDIAAFLGTGWNALVLTLFTRAEVRRLLYELLGLNLVPPLPPEQQDAGSNTIRNTLQIVFEVVVALGITGYGAYYVQYWPACNFVNMAIAILVGRAIQLETFRAILLASTLLVLYDGASVFLLPGIAAAAEGVAVATGTAETITATSLISSGTDVTSTIGNYVTESSTIWSSITNSVVDSSSSSSSNIVLSAAAAGGSAPPTQSAMASVALQKLTSTTFQPGLLVTKIDGNKLTGALGLGDQVFPAILATFLKRYDTATATATKPPVPFASSSLSSSSEDTTIGPSLFLLSLLGYILGCLLCEFVPAFSGMGGSAGIPALVFILPSMIMLTVLGAVASNQWDDLWNYNASKIDT